MSLTTAAIMKAIHDIVLSHPLLILSVFALSTLLSVLLVAFFVNDSGHIASSPTDEGAREYPWWNSDVPGYSPDQGYSTAPPILGSADLRSERVPMTNPDFPWHSPLPGSVDLRFNQAPWANSPLEISRQESELLVAVNDEYMKDDLKRLATFQWGSRETDLEMQDQYSREG